MKEDNKREKISRKIIYDIKEREERKRLLIEEGVERVTVTEDYYIDMIDDKRTCINGWTLDEVIQDWFENHSMGSYHATRDGHKIGNSREYVKTEIKER